MTKAERSYKGKVVAELLLIFVKTAANITNLESRALELGLVYPNYDQIVYLESQEANIEDFALALMESAYH